MSDWKSPSTEATPRTRPAARRAPYQDDTSRGRPAEHGLDPARHVRVDHRPVVGTGGTRTRRGRRRARCPDGASAAAATASATARSPTASSTGVPSVVVPSRGSPRGTVRTPCSASCSSTGLPSGSRAGAELQRHRPVVRLGGADAAAGAVPGLDHLHLVTGIREPPRGGRAGDARPDHDHPLVGAAEQVDPVGRCDPTPRRRAPSSGSRTRWPRRRRTRGSAAAQPEASAARGRSRPRGNSTTRARTGRCPTRCARWRSAPEPAGRRSGSASGAAAAGRCTPSASAS